MVTTSVILLHLKFPVRASLDPFGNIRPCSDTYAFLLSHDTDQRWYMFQNMGPAPSVRSGHRMAAVGTRIFVLGGESSSTGPSDDPTVIHVLDTSQSCL